jgi:adenosylmethionine-8-amino-7-oxononanoate aminotransferase
VIQRDGLLNAVRDRGAYLRRALDDRMGEHPYVGQIRGRGLLLGVEFVRDRVTKEPFDPSFKLHARIKSTAMDQGLLVYPMGGTIDGHTGDHVLIAPPFIVAESDIDQIVDRLELAINYATG